MPIGEREPGIEFIAQQPEYDDKPREACGVFGIYAPGENLAGLTYLALEALQHRGQEAAGMAVSDGESVIVTKDVGKVNEAFKGGRSILGFGEGGILASGHVRYGTVESDDPVSAANPMFYQEGSAQLALSHNGNLSNFDELCQQFSFNPQEFSSDSDLAVRIIGDEYVATGNIGQAIEKTVGHFEGAYSLVMMTEKELIGVRDPHGFRPLVLGSLRDGGWVLASETPALDIVDARFVREIERGEMVIIKDGKLTSRSIGEPKDSKLCAFEFVYFSRPDNKLLGESVNVVRDRMGHLLAEKVPVEADLVIGVPESGIDAAMGYAAASGVPFGRGLVKNHYVGRSFIYGTQDLRERAVRVKLNPITETVAGKKLVVVDDSIVRGTTTRTLVGMLREAGAREVHLRISSAPYSWPCFYGMDTGRPDELIASKMSVSEMCDYIGADSLAFLSTEDIQESVGKAAGKICMACMDGKYPTETPLSFVSKK